VAVPDFFTPSSPPFSPGGFRGGLVGAILFALRFWAGSIAQFHCILWVKTGFASESCEVVSSTLSGLARGEVFTQGFASLHPGLRSCAASRLNHSLGDNRRAGGGGTLRRNNHSLTRTSRNRKEERWPLSDDRMEAETACLLARL